MPRWGEHFIVANKILERVNFDLDKNLFLFGNIVPDIQNGHLVKGISNVQYYEVTHYRLDNEKTIYENFYEANYENISNPVALGVYAHLILDHLWNEKFHKRRRLGENGEVIGYFNKNNEFIETDRKGAMKDKQIDFEKFEGYIFRNYEFDMPKYDEKILDNCNILKSVDLNDDDIHKTIEYINNLKQESIVKDENLEIFSIEELDEYIDYSVEYILDCFNKINL